MAASCSDRGIGGKASAGGGPLSARPCSRPMAASSTNQWRASPDASSATWRAIRGPSLKFSSTTGSGPAGNRATTSSRPRAGTGSASWPTPATTSSLAMRGTGPRTRAQTSRSLAPGTSAPIAAEPMR